MTRLNYILFGQRERFTVNAQTRTALTIGNLVLSDRELLIIKSETLYNFSNYPFIKRSPPTMKKTSIIFILCALLSITACSTSENQTQATEATGTIEQVETDAILINNFKEKKDKYNPEAAIRFDIVDKYYDETGNKIKITDLNKNDDVKIILTNDFPIRETNPAQIDPKYVQKIILLNK